MKKEEFYEMLGNMDENAVKSSETAPIKKPKTKWIGFGASAAACLGLIIGIGIWFNDSKNPVPDNTSSLNAASSEVAIDIEQNNINIYYLEGENIQSISEYLPCDSKIIFNSWKSHNGIGDDVQLIEVRINNNGTESVDSLVANYSSGDKFTMNVTVTENLKKYYEVKSEEKLLDSLKQTLTGYSNIEFDEFNLVLE